MFEDQYKLHQTASDLDAQLEILKAYKAVMGFTSGTSHTGLTDPYDGEFEINGAVVELAAVKNRKCRFGQYPDLSIDCYAIDQLRIAAKSKQVEAVVLARFADASIFKLHVTSDEYMSKITTGYMKRGDRNERADRVYRFPIQNFTRI